MIDISKSYRYSNGKKARILCVDRPNFYNRDKSIISMGDNGSLHTHWEDGTSYNSDFNLVECSPYDHIHEGDIVEVRSLGYDWRLRRFAYACNGRVYTYPDCGDDVSSWSQCRLVCRKENEEPDE